MGSAPERNRRKLTTPVPFDAGLRPSLRAIRRASANNAFTRLAYACRRP